MKNRVQIGLMVPVFVLGASLGAYAAKKKGVDPSLYTGQDNEAAVTNLVTLAKSLNSGSWETIAIGRIYYLGGDKAKGQQIFDSVLNRKKAVGSDWIRVGRVYFDAGDWERAKMAFDKALQLEPKDAPWMAEIGAYYNVKGERAKAEELFSRSFALESSEYWPMLDVAGSYAGVAPKR